LTSISINTHADHSSSLTIILLSQHDDLPDLANRLGCGLENGCPNFYPDEEFDQVWQLKYVFHPIVPNLDEVEDDNSVLPTTPHRRLKSAGHKLAKGWSVFATVTKENFDPLSFSKQAGDYPENGTPSGGRWRDDEFFG
jgi:hypothetical protein